MKMDYSTVSFDWQTMVIQLLIIGFPLFSLGMFIWMIRTMKSTKQNPQSEKLQELEQRIERLEKKIDKDL